MTIDEAIKLRHSVRAYKDIPLGKDVVESIKRKIEEINKNSGLNIQLVLDEPKAFSGLLAKYGKFRGVKNYIIIAGEKSDDLYELVGYYGEEIVLFVQMLGLNSCWVGLSYSKVEGTYSLRENEKIACYISIGYGETNGSGHKIKSIKQVSNADNSTPLWFRKGVDAALLAPTAINQQKFFFEFVGSEDGKNYVLAHRRLSLFGYTQMDLGIAKYHFEVGAGRENFEWKSLG